MRCSLLQTSIYSVFFHGDYPSMFHEERWQINKNKDESTEVLIPWHKWHAGSFQTAHNAMMKIQLRSDNAVSQSTVVLCIRASVDALCRDGAGRISRERVQKYLTAHARATI